MDTQAQRRKPPQTKKNNCFGLLDICFIYIFEFFLMLAEYCCYLTYIAGYSRVSFQSDPERWSNLDIVTDEMTQQE